MVMAKVALISCFDLLIAARKIIIDVTVASSLVSVRGSLGLKLMQH